MKLIICEKDNAARRISGILGGSGVDAHKRGRVKLYKFRWDQDETTTVGLRGHILNMDFPKEYNDWSGIPPKALIDVEPRKKVSEKGIARVIRDLCTEADEVYVATDYDREGELIGAEAVEYALGKEALNDVWRAHFSSLTKDEVTRSFSDLVRVDLALSSAAETRQIIDLVWGATLTRFISLASNRLGYNFLSVGRVQSPTLALIVNKEKEIEAFEPVPYWRIEGRFGKERIEFGGHHREGDIFEREKALSIHSRVRNEKEAEVSKISKRERKDRPPTPFNTTQFIRAANSTGMSAARIMKIAEDLYTSGYISYPRTDNTVYPKGINLREVVEKLSKGPYKKFGKGILEKASIKPTRGKVSTTDHPPIYPTEYVTESELGKEKFRIYDLVVRRFLATMMDPCIVKSTSLRLDVNGEVFNASGLRMIDPGWRAAYVFSKVTEVALPDLEKGDKVDVLKIELLEKETRPPNRYSEGGLIQEMEALGLGTKSTRHEIIQKLYSRRYIDGSPPQPTLSGRALIETLERHAGTITEHGMTSKLEKDMERISKAELEQIDVLTESREMLSSILTDMEKHRDDIGKEISEALEEQDIVGKCPRCSNDLKLVRSKWGKRYVRCSMYPGCSKSYPLPQRGKIAFPGEICEECRSPMMTMYRKRSRPLTVCMNPGCPSKERYKKEKAARKRARKKEGKKRSSNKDEKK